MIVMREALSSSNNNLTKDGNSTIKQDEKYCTIPQRDDKQGKKFCFSMSSRSQATAATRNGNFYISTIKNQDRNNSLAVGDRLLSINSCDATNTSHDQAFDISNSERSNVKLTLYQEKTTNQYYHSSEEIFNNTIEVCFLCYLREKKAFLFH